MYGHVFFPEFYTGTELAKLLESFFYSIPTESKPPISIDVRSRPASESKQDIEPDHVILQMAVAGCKESDIKVWCEDKALIVQGSNNRSDISNKFRLDFKRTFPVSKDLDPLKAIASVEDGILTIKIPVADKVNNRTYILGGKNS